MKLGDEVFYWTRRKGESARLIIGYIIQIEEGPNPTLARVRGHDTAVQVHSIELKRLKPIAELPEKYRRAE